MAQTSLPYGSPQAVQIQSAGLFAATMQRNTTINRLSGQLPTQSASEGLMRTQSSNTYPIVICKDLQKTAGDEITFDLINHLGGKPIMGGANAEGLGESLSFDQDKLRINQCRKPISAGDTMTQQRTRWQLRSLARSLGESYMNRLTDQCILVHLAGSRGFHDNIEWAIPLAADPDFAQIMVNKVRAPTRNRHFLSTSTGLETVSATANEINIATGDVLNETVVDALRTHLDSMPLPPSPVIFDGDKMASDAPMRVLLCSSENYTSFVQSTNFRTLQSNAMARSQMAGGNPLFTGEAGFWNGILIIKMPKPIRFHAGDSLAYCESKTSDVETIDALVPAAFGTTHAVDRSILLGGQALAMAYGKNNKTGNPYFWSEKELDHGDKLEVLIGSIMGSSKIRFLMDHGSQSEFTDNGVLCIDSAVSLVGLN